MEPFVGLGGNVARATSKSPATMTAGHGKRRRIALSTSSAAPVVLCRLVCAPGCGEGELMMALAPHQSAGRE